MNKIYTLYVYFLLFSIVCALEAQSAQDINKLKSEYEKFQKDQIPLQSTTNDFQERTPTTDLPSESILIPYSEDNIILEEENLHFGYDFFTLRDSIPFWENLPTPSNYLLGPGDELIISLWGETQLRETYIISREGKIYDDKVGLLSLSGRTITSAREYLQSQFSRVYSTLKGAKASTFIDISIGQLRSINVNFVGQVKFPGVYPIHPFSNLITGLIQAGGVDTTGSLRNIYIKRNENIIKTIDLYDFFINGNISSSIQLRDNDIIVVPPRKSIIYIDSAVVRPGYYESIDNETVYDMIQYAGGKTYNASEKVGIRRLKSKQNRKDGILFEGLYVDYQNTKSITINSGDEITVLNLFPELQQVEIIGQVKVPGFYHFYKGMTLVDLLTLGGGFNDSTFVKSVYMDKAEIIRRDPITKYDKVISFNIADVINNEISGGILLHNLDRVVIHENLNFFEKENVLILGEVNVPGSYPLISDNESLDSFLNRAGGLTSKALNNGISIYRNKKYFEIDESEQNEEELENRKIETKVRVAWQNTNISLMPGDSVVVKEKTATVFVKGEIYNPGVLEYRNGESLRYYINAAGGLTESANKKGIIVLYASGMVTPNRWYSSPKIFEGATIIVNSKAIDEPFDITQFATNWTSIISSMITAIVLAQQLNATQ